MPVLTNEEREAFLRERGVVMRIAVVRPDGSPLVTPIWFFYDGEAILFTPRERSEWFGCLRQDTRVALCIDEQPHPYRKVVIEGTAELLYDVGHDDDWRDTYMEIAKQFIPDEHAEAYLRNTINERRGLYRVVLADAKVRTWRMPLKGEDNTGIWAKSYYNDPNIKF